ncbi:unnamed protein product [Phytophthora lilii]|uniref:Unnamed protein product n=1 Tax=Phytophthora lilii TaxID=2077276 RepID=A0A9W6TST0_9STRA|nr:unnamed protein product [Phytophthora lilii]
MATESCRHRAERRRSGVRDDPRPQHVDVVDREQYASYEPADVRRVEEELVRLALAVAQLLHEGGDVERDDRELHHEEELQQVQVHAAASVHGVDQVRQSAGSKKKEKRDNQSIISIFVAHLSSLSPQGEERGGQVHGRVLGRQQVGVPLLLHEAVAHACGDHQRVDGGVHSAQDDAALEPAGG